MLGEGNFGTVCEGEHINSKGQLKKVAVKSLKTGAITEDRLKFLQEAAIMVQFKHPNIVKVHGVVIVDEPVSGWGERGRGRERERGRESWCRKRGVRESWSFHWMIFGFISRL